LKNQITSLLDLFYPIFKRIMPLTTFRYATCGAINTLLGLLIWYTCYHYVFNRIIVDIGIYAFQPYTLALLVSSSFSFGFGFILNKFVVFTASNLGGRIQLFRYFLSFSFNLVLNYFLLKLMVEAFNWDAFISQLITTLIVIFASYISQKHFTFKVK